MVRVSAIIIFHNEQRFLGEAIASVRAQTFSDWELILVDDGSTDRSPEIAREAAAQDARIRVVAHSGGANRGMSASRNRGIAEARGEFIAFLDGDDVWTPEKLAEQVAILDEEPDAAMVYGRTRIWHSWDPDATTDDYCYPLGVPPGRLYRPPALFGLLMRNRAQSPTSINAIMRRGIVVDLGGFEEQFRAMFEDQVFFAKMHLAAPCHVADRIWALYRQHDANCTRRVSMREELAALARYLDWVSGYIRRKGMRGSAIRWPLLRAKLECRFRQLRAFAGSLLGRR